MLSSQNVPAPSLISCASPEKLPHDLTIKWIYPGPNAQDRWRIELTHVGAGLAHCDNLRRTSHCDDLSLLLIQIIGLRQRQRENDLTRSTRLDQEHTPVATGLDEHLVLLIQCSPEGHTISLDFPQHIPNALPKCLSPAFRNDPLSPVGLACTPSAFPPPHLYPGISLLLFSTIFGKHVQAILGECGQFPDPSNASPL